MIYGWLVGWLVGWGAYGIRLSQLDKSVYQHLAGIMYALVFNKLKKTPNKS